MYKKNTNFKRLILIGLILIAILIYMFVPSVNRGLNTIMKMFATGDFEVVKAFVASYGIYAAIVSFLLMVLQSIVAPLPAFLITFANANLFGW